MSRVVRRRVDRADIPLALYTFICCVVGGGLVVSLYVLMQPTRIGNPGIAAYKPPPGTVLTLDSSAPRGTFAEPFRRLSEPALQTVGQSRPPQTVESKKAASEVKPERPKRKQQPVQKREQPDPRANWAYQPFFGGGTGFWR